MDARTRAVVACSAVVLVGVALVAYGSLGGPRDAVTAGGAATALGGVGFVLLDRYL